MLVDDCPREQAKAASGFRVGFAVADHHRRHNGSPGRYAPDHSTALHDPMDHLFRDRAEIRVRQPGLITADEPDAGRIGEGHGKFGVIGGFT